MYVSLSHSLKHVCACMHVYIYAHTHTHTHTHMCVCVCVCVQIYIRMCTYTYIYLYRMTSSTPQPEPLLSGTHMAWSPCLPLGTSQVSFAFIIRLFYLYNRSLLTLVRTSPADEILLLALPALMAGNTVCIRVLLMCC